MSEQQQPSDAGSGPVQVHKTELVEVEGSTVAQTQAGKDMNLNMILDIPVDVHAELGQTEISIREILRLGPGSIVELDRLAGSPADIIVNGKLIGQGDIVVVNDNFGVRISKLVDPEKRVESL